MTKNKTLTLAPIIQAALVRYGADKRSGYEDVPIDEVVRHNEKLIYELSEKTKQTILQWVADEVVGEIEPSPRPAIFDDFHWRHAQNSLRTEQRQILKAHGWKGDGS